MLCVLYEFLDLLQYGAWMLESRRQWQFVLAGFVDSCPTSVRGCVLIAATVQDQYV